MKKKERISKLSMTLVKRTGLAGRLHGAETQGMRLAELKALWQAEHEDYKLSEVGTGVQRFVWEMLTSEEFFGLTQGLKSTPDHKRRSEYLLEERRKNGQADAVIFMDAEVVIPVEVERFEKARVGEWQILNYRSAFEKKYGILTDGFEWRFYYGEIADETYYKFTLQQMFADPGRFRTFWDEYVKPGNYYLAFFQQVGQQSFAFHDEPKSVDGHPRCHFQFAREPHRPWAFGTSEPTACQHRQLELHHVGREASEAVPAVQAAVGEHGGLLRTQLGRTVFRYAVLLRRWVHPRPQQGNQQADQGHVGPRRL